jgi:2-dehydro-3-deoxyphosphooctonate aldolase (KDO 8-P synthase)
MRDVIVGKVRIGNRNPLALIAGPCVIESEDATLEAADRLKQLSGELGIPFIFKSSYDKANRSSVKSYRGPGIKEGLRILRRVKRELGLPLLSDVHRFEEIGPAAEVLDVIQVPRSSRARPTFSWKSHGPAGWSISRKASSFHPGTSGMPLRRSLPRETRTS